MAYETAYELVIAQLRSQNPAGQPLSYEPQLVAVAAEVGRAIIAQFREGNEDAELAFDEDGSSLDFLNWDEFEADLIALSQQHPDYIFILDGEGQESRDMWRMYFHNGLMQMCPAIVTYPRFNPANVGLPTEQSVAPEPENAFFLITYNDSGNENYLFVTTGDSQLSKAQAKRYLAQEWDMLVEDIYANDIQIIGPVYVDQLDRIG